MCVLGTPGPRIQCPAGQFLGGTRGSVTPHGTSTESGNLEEPDPEVLSVPKSHTTGIAEGQLSLDIGDLVSACTTVADLSQKVQALSKSDKFAYLRQHSKPDPQFKFPKNIPQRMQS